MAISVFVSYSRKDSGFALQLAHDLKSSGVPVWVDQWDIPAGVSWPQAIQEALKDCTHFLIVLSPSSVASTEVQHELNYALSKAKHILPVLYAPCEMPYRIQSLEYIDFVKGQYQDSIQELVQLFTRTTRLMPPQPHVAPGQAPQSPHNVATGLPSATTTKTGWRTCAFSAVMAFTALVAVLGVYWAAGLGRNGVEQVTGWFSDTCDSPSSITESAAGGPWSSGDVAGVELVVDGVDLQNDQGTSTIHVTAKNNTKQAVRLFIFGKLVVSDDANTTYEADPFASSWPQNGMIPACDVVSGAILLEAPIDPAASTIRMVFTDVALGWGSRDIGVEGITLQ
jgi:hypothetical protein